MSVHLSVHTQGLSKWCGPGNVHFGMVVPRCAVLLGGDLRHRRYTNVLPALYGQWLEMGMPGLCTWALHDNIEYWGQGGHP